VTPVVPRESIPWLSVFVEGVVIRGVTPPRYCLPPSLTAGDVRPREIRGEQCVVGVRPNEHVFVCKAG